MAQKPSTSRERIIPIHIEGGDDSEKDKNASSVAMETAEDFLPEVISDEQLDNFHLEEFEKDTPEPPAVPRSLPMFNIKERIIFIIDGAEDENFTPFRLKNQQNKPLDMLKRAIEIFLYSKHMISKKHEYALAVLNENSVVWLANFTNNITTILNAVQMVEPCVTEDIFQLNNLFNTILKNVDVPEMQELDGTVLPPPYVVRAILLYGRSYTMPKLKKTQQIDKLLNSPYFTLDVLMTHEPVDEYNNCNKIFKELQMLDEKGYAYFLPVARDTKCLFSAMSQLLSHPLQRPTQQLADYSID